jgi:hypothetical protein
MQVDTCLHRIVFTVCLRFLWKFSLAQDSHLEARLRWRVSRISSTALNPQNSPGRRNHRRKCKTFILLLDHSHAHVYIRIVLKSEYRITLESIGKALSEGNNSCFKANIWNKMRSKYRFSNWSQTTFVFSYQTSCRFDPDQRAPRTDSFSSRSQESACGTTSL